MLGVVAAGAAIGLLVSGAAPAGARSLTSTESRSAAILATALPTRLSHIGDSRQILVVTALDWTTSRARLSLWQEYAVGDWQRTLGPVKARLGWNGFVLASNRRQGDGATPAGTFRLKRGFGRVRPPGVSLRYHVVDRNDWWPYDPRDPSTYNVFQFHRASSAQWRTTWAEHLWNYRGQYRYAVVVNFNVPTQVTYDGTQHVADPTANTKLGGGIFVHVNGSGATAGCVSVRRQVMRKILRRLDPTMTPRIVMGPKDVIEKM
jgi:L,D-peptidoglycan transpeptidase YkuD (ErfK/YbiS/YcfS/YnhG family)